MKGIDPERAGLPRACRLGAQRPEFEEYDTPETRTEHGIARMPGGGEAAWFKDSEGNLVGLVPA
jgi:hypothetical protein